MAERRSSVTTPSFYPFKSNGQGLDYGIHRIRPGTERIVCVGKLIHTWNFGEVPMIIQHL